MTEERKFVTFRDLKEVPKPTPDTSTSTPSTSSSPSRTRTPRITSNTSTPIAPERDFQRVPNSVTREAVPQGVYRGKSKQVWDYLYSVTRGSIVARRTVRKSRKEIKAGSGLGSMVTVDAAIEHLTAVGLIAVKPAIGSLIGNEYEVFTPEEAANRYTSTPSISRTTSLTQNLDNLDILESGNTSTTQVIDSKARSVVPNTSFNTKDINTDDEAARLGARFREFGKGELTRFHEVLDVLQTEFQIAAARTTVSDAGAFLAEHLRRRLFKLDKKQMESRAAAQTEPVAAVDARKCEDCGGTGWTYEQPPFGGAVRRCMHERLKPE